MVSHLETDEVLEFLQEFIEENSMGENQHISTLLEALEEAAETEQDETEDDETDDEETAEDD